MAEPRAQWASRMGFILAAAGSAVGLGNIWRFSYTTGENGGGLFVLTYIACVALIGLPIMMAEIFIGRETQASPVPAYRKLTRPRSCWLGLGWLSVVTAFVILSFYSVVAGWTMHYTWLSITEGFAGRTAEQINALWGATASNSELTAMWHIIFMALTVGIVIAGIRRGIELWTRILMPALFLILLVLLVYSISKGHFVQGLTFLFAPETSEFKPRSVLAALGQAFFSLSLGMGALITYGSYLRRNDDLVSASITVTVIDTLVALMSGMVLFPILFAAGLDADQGTGLAFKSLPLAFANMPGGIWLAPAFFLLLFFAALTSAISLLEVAAAYFIDDRGWSRTKAALMTGGAITLLGLPSAFSATSKLFGAEMTARVGRNWFDLLDYVSTNWMLPLGGLGIAVFVAWRVGEQAREQGFKAGSRLGKLYWSWVMLLRYIVPIAVLLVFLNAIEVFDLFGGKTEPVESLPTP